MRGNRRVFDGYVGALLKAQERDGSWGPTYDPGSARVRDELALAYTHQVVLFLASFPTHLRRELDLAADYLERFSIGDPLFDLTLKIRPLISLGHVEYALELGHRLALLVGPHGHVDYSKRREAAVFDPLVTLEALAELRRYERSDLLERTISALCRRAVALSPEAFEFGDDYSNWVWAAAVLGKVEHAPGPSIIRALADKVIQKRSQSGMWLYSPAFSHTNVPHYSSTLVFTSHVVISACALSRSLPEDILEGLIDLPCAAIAKALMVTPSRLRVPGPRSADRSSPYAVAVAWRALMEAGDARPASRVVTGLLSDLGLDRIPQVAGVARTALRAEFTASDSSFVHELLAVLREMSIRLDALERSLSGRDIETSVEWTLPLIPHLLTLKRNRSVGQPNYPSVDRLLGRIEKGLGIGERLK